MRGLPYISRSPGPGSASRRNPILGSDVAGQVEAVGAGVTQFDPETKSYGFVGSGAFAEYAAVPEEAVGSKPAT